MRPWFSPAFATRHTHSRRRAKPLDASDGGVARRFQFIQNRLNNSVNALHHIVGPKADHAIAFRLKPLGPPLVMFDLIIAGMLTSIDLNDEPAFETNQSRRCRDRWDVAGEI